MDMNHSLFQSRHVIDMWHHEVHNKWPNVSPETSSIICFLQTVKPSAPYRRSKQSLCESGNRMCPFFEWEDKEVILRASQERNRFYKEQNQSYNPHKKESSREQA